MPMIIHCLQKQFLFFHRLINLTGNNLVSRALNESYHLKEKGHFSWINSCCLYFEAFVGIDSNPSKLRNMKTKQFKLLVNRILTNSYERYWLSKIKSTAGPSNSGGNKLRTYATFKARIQREPYTKIKDKSLRRCLAKFRCSDHKLRIEVGRREKILVEERKCLMCNENVIEDEQHFLTTCPKYGTHRTQLYEKIGHSVPNFNSLSAEQKFIYMMSSESPHTVQWVACFIKNAFETRSTPSTT